jgi:hypothetical protein
MSHPIAQKRLTSRTAWLVAVIVLAAGIVLLVLSEIEVLASLTWLRLLLGSLGAVICTSVVVGVLWELVLKREAVGEMYATVALSERVREAGLINVAVDFQQIVSWSDLVSKCKEIDLFFAYSDRWRKNNTQALREAAQNRVRVRLLLPDYRDASVLDTLADRYQRPDVETNQQAKERIANAIRENVTEFRQLLQGDKARGKLDLWVIRQVPLVTLYRIDDVAVVVSYNQTGERNYVPCLSSRRGGFLFEFVEHELTALMSPTFPKSEKIEDIETFLNPTKKNDESVTDQGQSGS